MSNFLQLPVHIKDLKGEILMYQKLKRILFICSVILCLGMFPITSEAAVISGTKAEATTIELGVPCMKIMSDMGSWYFKFTTTEAGYIDWTTSHSSTYSMQTFLYDLDSNEIAYSDKDFSSRKIGLQPGTYYIWVRTVRAETITISMDFVADRYVELEPNNDFDKATPMEKNHMYKSFPISKTDDDIFSLALAAGEVVELRASSITAARTLSLYYPDRTTQKLLYIGKNQMVYDPTKGYYHLYYTPEYSGTYYISTTLPEKAYEVGFFEPCTTGHTWDVPETTKNATCTTAGELSYKCKICGTAKSQKIEALGHEKDFGEIKTMASCVTNGERVYRCIRCDLVLDTEIIPATGQHFSDAGKIVTLPTYIQPGKRVYTCLLCKETLKEEIIDKLPQASLTDSAKIVLSSSKVVYTGKALKPSVSVKVGGDTISSGFYTVSYQNNTEIGKATVTVTAKEGNNPYIGSISASFDVVPKAIKIEAVTCIKAGQLRVKWEKGTKITGYEVELSTSKNFKSKVVKKTIAKAATKTVTVKKLTKNKKYYVRIRAYKTVKKQKFYSDWKIYKKAVNA